MNKSYYCNKSVSSLDNLMLHRSRSYPISNIERAKVQASALYSSSGVSFSLFLKAFYLAGHK